MERVCWILAAVSATAFMLQLGITVASPPCGRASDRAAASWLLSSVGRRFRGSSGDLPGLLAAHNP
jgi:hypothetical protein